MASPVAHFLLHRHEPDRPAKGESPLDKMHDIQTTRAKRAAKTPPSFSKSAYKQVSKQNSEWLEANERSAFRWDG